MRRPWFKILLPAGIVAIASLACGTAAMPDPPMPADWSLLPQPVRVPIRDAVDHCREHPRDPAAMETLGRIYHGNEQTALAAECYRRAIELGSTDARTHYLLGLIERQSGRAESATELLREAARLQPAYAPAQFNLGLAFLDLGRIDEAEAAIATAIERDDGDPAFHAALGRALRQAGRLERAETSLRRALELAPDDAEVHQLLGLTLQALQRPEDAHPHLERLSRQSDSVVKDPWLLEVQQHAATADILLDRAGTYLERGRVESALELLEQALVSYPDNAAVFRMLGKARLRAGERQLAVRAYVRATDLQPDDAEAHAALAMILSRHGKIADAEHEADLALAADPTHALAAVVKAGLTIRRGDPAEALAGIRPIVERRPDLVAAHVVHGEALYATGALEQAAAAFARAVELAPRSEYPRRRLGLTYRRLGRSAEARRELLLAAELDPSIDETRQALAELGATP